MMLFRRDGILPAARQKHAGELLTSRSRRCGTPTRPRRPTGMTELLLDAQQVRASSSAASSPSTTSTSRSRSVDRRPDRPQRGRQDDVLQRAHRPLQADRRHGRSSTARPSPGRAPHEIAALGHRPHVPEHPPVRHHDGAENVMVGHALRTSTAASGDDPRHAAVSAGRSTRPASTARELIEFCGVRGDSDEFAKNLSYGDQRRLEVARALALRPEAARCSTSPRPA